MMSITDGGVVLSAQIKRSNVISEAQAVNDVIQEHASIKISNKSG